MKRKDTQTEWRRDSTWHTRFGGVAVTQQAVIGRGNNKLSKPQITFHMSVENNAKRVEAFRKAFNEACEIFNAWNDDTGKPRGEVLR